MRKFLLGILLTTTLMLTGCSPYMKPITAEEFCGVTEQFGLTNEYVTHQFEDGLIDEVVVALAEDYQIEYYDFASTIKAKGAFETNKEAFLIAKELIVDSRDESSISHEFYEQETVGMFYFVARRGDTMIYVAEEIEYADEIRTVLQELGFV